ncbi:MAG TPA: hypothetical protein VGW78_01265 [Candidatus Babeliales bacterium]|jgi:hypothetical protein|nr:hypothetical protein [Candidatus Babeliales bacterium]
MNNKVFISLSIIFLLSSPAHAILTSVDLSCTTPTVLDTTTTIVLDADVSITDTCALIVAGPCFGVTQTDSIIFTSDTGNKIVIADGGMWDPSTFNSQNKQIQFAGNATLAVNKGGVLVVPGPMVLLGTTLALYRGAIVWLQNGTIVNQGTIESIPTEQ